jgi:hypothetical protein
VILGENPEAEELYEHARAAQDAAIAKMRKDWAAGHGPDDVLAGRTGRPASSDEAGRLRRRCASIGR